MNDLGALRSKIDEIDEQILSLLSERVKICRSIGSAKKIQGLPVEDPNREKAVFKHVHGLAAKLALSPVQVESVYHEIVNMCSAVQE